MNREPLHPGRAQGLRTPQWCLQSQTRTACADHPRGPLPLGRLEDGPSGNLPIPGLCTQQSKPLAPDASPVSNNSRRALHTLPPSQAQSQNINESEQENHFCTVPRADLVFLMTVCMEQDYLGGGGGGDILLMIMNRDSGLGASWPL